MENRITKVNLKGKEVKEMKILTSILGVLFILFAMVPVASAVPVENVWVLGENQISDDDAEVWVDVNTNGVFDIGDMLVGVVGITSYTTINEPASNYNELTSVFAIEVTGVTPLPGDFPIGSNVEWAAFSFGPTGDINAAILAAFGENPGIAGTDANTVAAIFEDPDSDFVRDGVLVTVSYQSAVDPDNSYGATADILRMILGIEGTNTWSATGPQNPLDPDILALAPGTGIGSFTANLTIQDEFFTHDFAPLVSVVGNIARPQTNSQWPLQSDSTYTLFVVPEPGTFVLLGSGLAGIGIFARFRRRK